MNRKRLAAPILGFILMGAMWPNMSAAQNPSPSSGEGSELVLVYVSGSNCGSCLSSEYLTALESAKELVEAQAAEEGYTFATMGIALDQDVAAGYEFMTAAGPWDELILGKNWTNLGASELIWQQSAIRPSMPQVIIARRNVVRGPGGPEIGDYTAIVSYVGHSNLRKWVADGAVISQP